MIFFKPKQLIVIVLSSSLFLFQGLSPRVVIFSDVIIPQLSRVHRSSAVSLLLQPGPSQNNVENIWNHSQFRFQQLFRYNNLKIIWDNANSKSSGTHPLKSVKGYILIRLQQYCITDLQVNTSLVQLFRISVCPCLISFQFCPVCNIHVFQVFQQYQELLKKTHHIA